MQKDLDKEPVCCETVEVHEDLLRIEEQTMPERQNCMSWQSCSRCLGIHPHTILFVLSSQKYVCVSGESA